MDQDDQADAVWFSTQRRYHPQLAEKAIIDLVNGLRSCRRPAQVPKHAASR